MKSLVLLLMIVWSYAAFAQPPCYQKYVPPYSTMSLPTVLPPLNSGMGLNELIAHIVLDSVCRTLESPQIDSFIQARTTWDDTLKSLLKYTTILVDNNPLTVFGITNAISPWRMSFPVDVRNSLAKAVVQHSPSPGLDVPISTCDYILRVTVQDTINFVDTSAQISKTSRVSTSTISTVVMGHLYPTCTTQALVTSPATTVDCITFDTRMERVSYARQEQGLTSDSTTIASILPKPSRQYLLFLKLTKLCSQSASVHFTIYPAYWVGSQCGVYEIVDSRISDELNYFGQGTNPLAQDVVNAFTSRIQTIKTWVP